MAEIPPPKKRDAPVYRAYLVRIWQEHAGASPRASAKPVDGRSAVRFATLDALFAYLEAQIASMPATDDSTADANESEDGQ